MTSSYFASNKQEKLRNQKKNNFSSGKRISSLNKLIEIAAV